MLHSLCIKNIALHCMYTNVVQCSAMVVQSSTFVVLGIQMMYTYILSMYITTNLWDLVEKDNFIYLPQIARIAQTFPTSSAAIEQAFSILKSIKENKRYNLSKISLLRARFLFNKNLEARMRLTFQMKLSISFAL